MTYITYDKQLIPIGTYFNNLTEITVPIRVHR